MNLHRQIGLGFATFCFYCLGWAFLTPDNPDHLTNLIIHGILGPIFLLSTTQTVVIGGTMQVLGLFFGAALTALAGDFQPASGVGSLSIFLIYAYSGFKSIRIGVVLPIAVIQFVGTGWAATVTGYSVVEAVGQAVTWTSFSLVGVWVIWLTFQKYAADIIKQNREVLDLQKEILKKGHRDGPKD